MRIGLLLIVYITNVYYRLVYDYGFYYID